MEPTEETARAVREVVVRLLGDGVAVAVWGIDATDARLHPSETRLVSRSVPSRREEFARGRACARAALVTLGLPAVEILVGEHREPLWPDSIVGSITHAGGVVAAAASSADRYRGVGLDIEVLAELEDDVLSAVLTAAERDAVPRSVGPIGVFSAKEAVHKAIFPRSGRWLDFLEVEVEFSDDGRFLARGAESLTDPPRELAQVRGRMATAAGFVISAATLGPPSEVE